MRSRFPSNWKHSKIIPLPKSNGDYRSIAILPYLAKVFEKLAHMKMNSFINSNSLLCTNQSGFREKHSCITALINVSEEIRKYVDEGRINVLVLLDHSKSFDKVVH